MANDISNLNANFPGIDYTGKSNKKNVGADDGYLSQITNLINQAASDPIWSDETINNIVNTPVGPGNLGGTGGADLVASTGGLADASTQGQLTNALGQVSNLFYQATTLMFTASEPNQCDCCHPAGSLQVGSDGSVTTPGGYKIEQTGQYGWKITGKDGKTTEIWGDPHVKEGDGGNWDFKRDSTFVLADGTRINVNTTPYNNMTVTKGLEIISGNDRVQVTDIDKGKGKTGQVTQDGYAHVNSFGNKDAFVMGKETDDWSFTGKEIVGSNDGGNSFKLGNDLAAGVVGPIVEQNKQNGGGEFIGQLMGKICEMFDAIQKGFETGKLPDMSKLKLPETSPESEGAFGKNGLDVLKKSFAAVAAMLDALSKVLDLAQSIPSRRTYQQA